MTQKAQRHSAKCMASNYIIERLIKAPNDIHVEDTKTQRQMT